MQNMYDLYELARPVTSKPPVEKPVEMRCGQYCAGYRCDRAVGHDGCHQVYDPRHRITLVWSSRR